MKGLFVTIVICCMVGCANKGKTATGILRKEKMQAVMWDIIRADVFVEQFVKKDSLKSAAVENMQLQNNIFELHKVTREEYYESFDYYVSHTDLMRVMLDSMTAKGERNRGKMMERHGRLAHPK